MKLNKICRRGAAVASAAAMVLAAGCGADSGGETVEAGDDGLVKIVIGGTEPTMTTSPVLTMVDYDIDAKHGLDAEFVGAGSSGAVVIQSLLRNEYPVGFASSQAGLDAISQGAELEIVTSAFKQGHGLVVTKETAAKLAPVTPESSIEERLDALRGLTIVTSAPGSGVNITLRTMLAENGIDPDKDVKIIGVSEASAMLAGLQQGRFDAAMYSSGIIEAAVADGTADLWMSIAVDDVGPIKDSRGLSLFARPDFVENNQETVDALRAALTEATEKIQADPEAVGEKLKSSHFPDLDQAVWDLAWENIRPAFPTDGKFPRSSFDFFNEIAPEEYSMSYEDVVYEEARAE